MNGLQGPANRHEQLSIFKQAGDSNQARATIPLGRFSTAPDVANAALSLSSDEAAFISGVCIEVDGARCI